MGQPFIGSEAVASGQLVKSALRTQYKNLLRDVYVGRNIELTPEVLGAAAWLWSRRRGVVAGLTASAMHGAQWVESSAPLEILHTNRNPLPGIKVHSDRIEDDEIIWLDGIPVTTLARTTLDLGCWYPTDDAVARIDALLAATDLKPADVVALAQRYPGRRGIRNAGIAIDLADGGSQSPKETWLRLLLIRAGFPRPKTQIPVCNDFGEPFAYLDMGWEDLKVSAEYDGEHHRTDRRRHSWDIRRQEKVEGRGWINIRVVAGERPADIIQRVAAARARRALR
ncbi:hypothetical protein BST27_19225 [Mycobacterium intermedium]|uniref:DUF559 domain-containing protein n=1 Tax=Mycobacterium intermedium TaxID=28445 RepID=A0A1E3S7K3_MYCIE|nr:hypothetical protein [Mycobacterium intermedium]MCV6966300.1 hypothetical protein [Mycobacterium intermedium]ODQ98080.1 hypothetical protein BHQ20_23720 [Mycobacterium intermedium]OPE47247.1 hypothetical protein BV508_22780 [Mycobacterium intermedium]ORA99681.1 hypothetical protein BST27_19225 [Mycobacterium intermedium]